MLRKCRSPIRPWINPESTIKQYWSTQTLFGAQGINLDSVPIFLNRVRRQISPIQFPLLISISNIQPLHIPLLRSRFISSTTHSFISHNHAFFLPRLDYRCHPHSGLFRLLRALTTFLQGIQTFWSQITASVCRTGTSFWNPTFYSMYFCAHDGYIWCACP